MRRAVDGELAAGRSHHVDATAIATNLLGDSIAANFLLLGYAAQLGLLPVAADSIDAAIELNGVAVDMNKGAFLTRRLPSHLSPRGSAALIT